MSHEFRSTKERVHDQATLIERPGKGDLSAILVLGNGALAAEYAHKLGPCFEEFGTSYFISYPQKGFSIDSITERFLEAYDSSSDNRKALFSCSMGLMVTNHLMTIPEVEDTITDADAGKTDYWICDSGVTRISNLHPYVRALLHEARSLRSSHAIARACDWLLGADGAWRYASLSQLHWMEDQSGDELIPGSLAHVSEHIPAKHYLSAHYDWRVNLESSFKDLNTLHDGKWRWTKSRRRPWISHSLKNPDEYRMILRKPPGEFRETTISKSSLKRMEP